ncbi:MAG: hypothetical protein AB1410_05340 [Acidobacteriota bacterium]
MKKLLNGRLAAILPLQGQVRRAILMIKYLSVEKSPPFIAGFFKMLIVVLIVASSFSLYADRRSYVWTYEYLTMHRGGAEIEYYLTLELPDKDKGNVNNWKHWMELEYGITDHWDISIYQQFTHKNSEHSSSFYYDGFKIRTRIRIGERDQFPLDPLIYLEYKNNGNLSEPGEFEGKLILAKTIGNLNFSYNQILERELVKGVDAKHEYATGLSYEFNPRIKLGIESKGNFTDKRYYLGPTISFATSKFWISLGVASGLNKESRDIDFRLLLGIPL